ncbi:MAG: FAD binding domain-containing protein [Acidimicrobiia bacterium]
MKPAPFEYHAPEIVDDVVGLLAEHGDEAKPLAGGQSLVPMLAMRLTRFEHLVDLQRVDSLAGVSREDGHLRVGAMTRQRELERRAEVGDAVPLLARATPLVGHFQIRNRGTVGGSLAHADPASEYPAVAVALDAEFEVVGGGGLRRVAASEFFVSTWTTCLEPDEVLVAARFPVWGGRCGFAVDEVARRHGDFALAGVACAVTLDERGAVTRAGIGLFGMGSTPVRAAAAETALMGNAVADADLDDVGALAARDAEPLDDVHATAGYRRAVGAHLVTRVVGRALAEAARE